MSERVQEWKREYERLCDEYRHVVIEWERCAATSKAAKEARAKLDDHVFSALSGPTSNTSPVGVGDDGGVRQSSDDSGEIERLRGMLAWCAVHAWEGMHIDGGGFQDEMIRRGLFVEVPASDDVREQYDTETMYTLSWTQSSETDITNRADSENERAPAEAKSVPGTEREALADRLGYGASWVRHEMAKNERDTDALALANDIDAAAAALRTPAPDTAVVREPDAEWAAEYARLSEDYACFSVTYGLRHKITVEARHALDAHVRGTPAAAPEPDAAALLLEMIAEDVGFDAYGDGPRVQQYRRAIARLRSPSDSVRATTEEA